MQRVLHGVRRADVRRPAVLGQARKAPPRPPGLRQQPRRPLDRRRRHSSPPVAPHHRPERRDAQPARHAVGFQDARLAIIVGGGPRLSNPIWPTRSRAESSQVATEQCALMRRSTADLAADRGTVAPWSLSFSPLHRRWAASNKEGLACSTVSSCVMSRRVDLDPRADRRRGAAAPAAARLPADPRDVAPRRAGAGRALHRRLRRSAGLGDSGKPARTRSTPPIASAPRRRTWSRSWRRWAMSASCSPGTTAAAGSPTAWPSTIPRG